MTSKLPKRFALDRRAVRLADELEAEGGVDDIFLTDALADRLGISKQWLEIGRCQGYGPEHVKIGGMRGYRRDAAVGWLRERATVHAEANPKPNAAPVVIIRGAAR